MTAPRAAHGHRDEARPGLGRDDVTSARILVGDCRQRMAEIARRRLIHAAGPLLADVTVIP